MSSKKNRIKLTVICLLGLLGLFAGMFLSQKYHLAKNVNMAQFHGTYLERPRSIKPFHLKGIDHKPFENAQLEGKWTFVFFGFTRCGYLCPTTLAELGKMHRILEKKTLDLPQVVMISIDPERDTLDKLEQYVHAFHPSFFAARGNDKKIDSMTREMGVVSQKIRIKGADSKQYDIQHSGALMLFNPQGQLNAFFTLPHQASALAKDYMLLIS